MSACTDWSIGSDARPDLTVVTPAGEIDLGTRAELRSHLDACSGDVVVDLTGVELLDAGGMGVLVGTRNRLHGDGGSLVVRDPRPSVRRALVTVGLGDWIAA